MNEANNEINNLSDLSKLNDTDQPITNSEPKIDSLGRSYATGRRKELQHVCGLKEEQVMSLLMEKKWLITSLDQFCKCN